MDPAVEFEKSLSPTIFSDKREFLKTVNEGISGKVVKWLVQESPEQRIPIIQALSTTSGNLSRFYNKKSLSKQQTEEVLDILKIHVLAAEIFGDVGLSKEWMAMTIPALDGSRPLDLLDTFIGRSMISEVLEKIKWGEFS